MNTLGKNVALAACAVVFTACCAQAGGADRNAGRQVVVSYGDLDLSRTAGAEVLISRLERAASLVCGTQPDMRHISQATAYRACSKATMDDAVDSVAAPMVSLLYGAPMPVVASDN